MTNLQNMKNKLSDMGVTLTVVTTQFGSKFVHIHCQNFKGISRTFICNTVSFTTAWADNAILQDAEVIKYIEDLLNISLSLDAVVNTGEQKIIDDIEEEVMLVIESIQYDINSYYVSFGKAELLSYIPTIKHNDMEVLQAVRSHFINIANNLKR